MATIDQLTTEREWRSFYPVVTTFWPIDDVDEHVRFLRTMTDQGYHAFGLTTEQPTAFAWLVDLVTHPDQRGNGYGTRLYTAVEAWARDQDCETIVLASGQERTRAHRFYESHGFEATEYWFEKSLTTD